MFVSTAYMAAAGWFEAHLISWSLDDLKSFSQQMCSILLSASFAAEFSYTPKFPIVIDSNEFL